VSPQNRLPEERQQALQRALDLMEEVIAPLLEKAGMKS
jgi:hypothetical protein